MPVQKGSTPFSQEDETSEAPQRRPVGPPRPAQCKKFARARFAEALPDIMTKLLAEVQSGNVGYLKVLLELTGLDKPDPPPRPRKVKEKTLEQILLEQWHKDGEERAAQEAEDAQIAAQRALAATNPSPRLGDGSEDPYSY